MRAVLRKVFLLGRLASLLLTVDPNWQVRAFDPFRCAWSATKLSEHP